MEQESKILARGAEAVIIKEKSKVIKNRISKSYRLPELDEKLRKLRTRSEAKIIQKLQSIIPVPKFIKTDEKTKQIEMKYISGKKLSVYLDKLKNYKSICKQIGKSTAKLHDSNIIHGDLTTSNLILKNKKVYFIDFGLGFHSSKIEDKAVDLHLIKESMQAKHSKIYESAFSAILEGYKSSKNYDKTIKQLKKVEKRGRYK